MKIGKRILVIGSPGSGKSTFAQKLAEITGIKLIHLDKEFWNYGWRETPRAIWEKKLAELIAGDEWIIDGNYGSTLALRLAKADTVVFFDLTREVCIISYLKRVITNLGKTRPDMAEGCPERFDTEFVKYIWHFPQNSKQKIVAELDKWSNGNLVVFKKRSEAARFLQGL